MDSTVSPAVLRLRGVVERIEPSSPSPTGSAEESTETVHLQDLRQAATGKPLDPTGAQLPFQQNWRDAGVQAGDTVLFTTTSRFLIDPGLATAEQAADVVVIRRPKAANSVPAPVPVIPPPHDSEPPISHRRPTLWPLAAISLMLAALTGGLIGWNLAQRSLPPSSPPAAERSIP